MIKFGGLRGMFSDFECFQTLVDFFLLFIYDNLFLLTVLLLEMTYKITILNHFCYVNSIHCQTMVKPYQYKICENDCFITLFSKRMIF